MTKLIRPVDVLLLRDEEGQGLVEYALILEIGRASCRERV